jgi:hypothetical protein
MRFYLKLILACAAFAFGGFAWPRQLVVDVAYELRVAYVWRCGSAQDFERLLDDTQHALARERGELETYEFGKRHKQLLAERLAQAAAAGDPLSEETRLRIDVECAREAYGATHWARQSIAAVAPIAPDLNPLAEPL